MTFTYELDLDCVDAIITVRGPPFSPCELC